METDFKTVGIYDSPATAEIIAARLRSEGIPAQVFGRSSSFPGLQGVFNNAGVKVKVNADDYEEALRLLKDAQDL